MQAAPNADEFNPIVYEIVKQIPSGNVVAYGQIAAMIPPSEDVDDEQHARYGAQWVGAAMNASPDGVPWQRVINSKGEISLPDPTGTRQRKLLEDEGVKFDGKGRISWDVYGWDGPDETWLHEHGLNPLPSLKKKKPDVPEQPKLF